MAIPTKAAGSSRVAVQQSWGDHPLVYVISGASRGEAVGQLVQKEPEHPNIKNQQKGLGFHLINSGESLTAWEIFLLSTALNASDPNSRPPNYFERTDQVAFICLELSNRKDADASFRDIAVEICFNPFLSELRNHLNLSPSTIPLRPIEPSQDNLPELVQSRLFFPWLPDGMGVLIDSIPSQPLEALDVLIDMATCVNSDRMKRITPEAAQAKQKESLASGAGSPAKTEGFLHARAEDQLRHLFKEIVPLESASTFDVLVIRDLVGIVFGAIQECSRQFRQNVASNRQANGAAAKPDLTRQHPQGSVSSYSSASNPLAATYWIERIVYEALPGGLLAGLWNFPAAALVILFYIYFVNRIQQFNKVVIQENILRLGTVLYRCIAELALTLRSSKVTLINSSIAVQIRVLEGASLLFRIALFGSVKVQVFPHHPFQIPAHAVQADHPQPTYEIKTFDDMETLYEFLYQHWFKGIIVTRLPPTMDYREAPSSSQRQQLPARGGGGGGEVVHRRNWYDAKRLDVAATANRLRQEVEAIMSVGSSTQGSAKVRVKRLGGGKRSAPGNASDNNKGRLPDSVEVEVVDPSILPMAQPARLEFLSLVFGVTSMLIEKHQCLETQPSGLAASRLPPNQTIQVLNVPANMIILAAVKVALSLIPPHFDRLAPFLVHWVDVRCRLIQWMWKTCKQELTKRAEEKWMELWAQHNQSTPSNAPRLEVRFTSHRQDGQPSTDLSLTKLAEIVPEILPGVLQSMTSFYEEHSDLPDERILRDFFGKWLKSSNDGDGDLITQMNTLLARPSPSSSNVGSTEHAAKRARHHDNRPLEGLSSDYLRVSNYGNSGVTTGHQHPSLSNHHRHQQSIISHGQSQITGSRALPSDDRDRASKRPRKPMPGRPGQSDGFEELGDWLETLPYTEKIRLNSLELPEWELPHSLRSSPSDLLRWRPPELLHPFSGNGLRGPAFETNEMMKIRQQQQQQSQEKSSTNDEDRTTSSSSSSPATLHQPISDLDWKVTQGVLQLLKSRGVDTLVSRGRGEVFFLDQMSTTNHPENLRGGRGVCVDSDGENEVEENNEDHHHRALVNHKVKKVIVVKKPPIDATAQKRYGASFFKQGDPLMSTVEEELAEQHIPDLDYVRSFLEFTQNA